MSKRPFSKPATTFAEQVALLQSRGMTVDDLAEAERHLSHINYYRLGAYWLPFEADHASHRFKPGTCFEDVIDLYRFDRQLRLLVLDAIERVEVSVRTQWAYHLAYRHGTHAHLDPSLASRRDWWQRHLDKLTAEVERADETFIAHLRNTYSEVLPPVWACCEVMSLGLLSNWYRNLKPMPTRRAIAAHFGLDDGVLASWLHHLTVVRNTCAHHARLWNREIAVSPAAPRSKPAALAGQFRPAKRIYNTLILLAYLLDEISPRSQWRAHLLALLDQHPKVDLAAMGFPEDWRLSVIPEHKS